MSRLSFDVVPTTFEAARRVIDSNFRTLRQVLDHGVLLREQFAGVIDVTANPSLFPLSYAVPRINRMPSAVILMRALAQGPESVCQTGGKVSWEWRSGLLVIHSIDGLTSGINYNVTLAVLE